MVGLADAIQSQHNAPRIMDRLGSRPRKKSAPVHNPASPRSKLSPEQWESLRAYAWETPREMVELRDWLMAETGKTFSQPTWSEWLAKEGIPWSKKAPVKCPPGLANLICKLHSEKIPQYQIHQIIGKRIAYSTIAKVIKRGPVLCEEG